MVLHGITYALVEEIIRPLSNISEEFFYYDFIHRSRTPLHPDLPETK